MYKKVLTTNSTNYFICTIIKPDKMYPVNNLYRWIDINFYKSYVNPFYTLYRTENYNDLGVFTKFGEWYYHHGAPNRFCNITKKWLIHLDEEPPPKPLTETKFHLVPKDTSTDPQI